MRYIKDIINPDFKISIYQWNNKYIVKIETGMLEQTYKIDEYNVASVDEIESSLDESFLASVRKRFDDMGTDFNDTLLRNEVIF